jgi:hypothetical protein
MTIDSQWGLAIIWPPSHRFMHRGRATPRDHPVFPFPFASAWQPKGRHADHRKHRTTDGDDPLEGNVPVARCRPPLTTTLTGGGQKW